MYLLYISINKEVECILADVERCIGYYVLRTISIIQEVNV